MNNLDVYAASFLDPFDSSIPQPKILDGSVTRSSGLKFRATGNITLDAAGGDNWFVLFPGFSHGMVWKIGAGDYTTHTLFPSHVENATARHSLNKLRLVSQGLKLSLLNSSDDNEGYWEAIRVPMEEFRNGWTLVDTTAPVGDDYQLKLGQTYIPATGLSNYSTFQTGRLRDIHRFLFKVNSNAPDHPFTSVMTTGGGASVVTVPQTIDPFFDVVIIRIVGRIDAVTPSMLQYDLVSNQEVCYKDQTALGRLHTMNTMVPNIDVLLDRTRFILPAIQIA